MPEHGAARPELPQLPKVIVEHLHQQQPAGGCQHEPENLQPLAQEMPVEGVQRRDQTNLRSEREASNKPCQCQSPPRKTVWLKTCWGSPWLAALSNVHPMIQTLRPA